MFKNIKDTMTYEDCLRFKAEHPNLKRGEVLHRFRACYMAMKRLNCLDELYPSKAIVYPHELTYEDCVKFKQKHPDMSRYDISAHYGKYYKTMKELGCIDELYPLSNRKFPKDITKEDCVLFRKDHPELSRTNLRRDFSGFYKAMKILNCLDELFPREIEVSFNTLTFEDCVKFRDEHPDLSRRELDRFHKRYLKAMIKFGCLEELYPNSRTYTHKLSQEDCFNFKNEHPYLSRREVEKHFISYFKAMQNAGVLDELYPKKREVHDKYSDEYLIKEVAKYTSKREVREKAYWLHSAIRSHKLESIAYSHMEVLGNLKKRMIYAYEFPDHSVYVGLTFDYKKRGRDHKVQENSAVRKYIKETGLKPIRKPLTGYLPVKEAKRMEGEFEEKYRTDNWKILNVAKTGGTGTTFNKADYQRVVELWKQGFPSTRIAEMMGVSRSSITYHLKHEGLLTNQKRQIKLHVEEIDDKGNVIHVFDNAHHAAETTGFAITSIRGACTKGTRVFGHLFRYNAEEYKIKMGKEYVYPNKNQKSKGTSKFVCQYTIDGEFVRSYKNARETAEYGFNYRHVSQVCNGKEKTHKGFVFRYEKEFEE